MAIKSEIAWTRRLEDGAKVEVSARRFGGEWRFYQRAGRHDNWLPIPSPLEEDWRLLLDALERRVARRLFPPQEVDRVRREMAQRFP